LDPAGLSIDRQIPDLPQGLSLGRLNIGSNQLAEPEHLTGLHAGLITLMRTGSSGCGGPALTNLAALAALTVLVSLTARLLSGSVLTRLAGCGSILRESCGSHDRHNPETDNIP
jgi:hypothetical protein